MTESPRIIDPFGSMEFEDPTPSRLVPASHPATDRAMADVFTAQRVAVKRNLPDILREAKVLAAAASQKFYYSIPFKERARDGKPERTVHVEGVSIDGAMAALSIYGNCRVEAFPANETASHWTFMARFVDYEKGVTVVRAFNQRKSQSTGMRDAERNLDIVFQIGQSKAIRNVIIGALKWLTDEMFLAAKSGVLERIQRNPEQARAWLTQQFGLIEVKLHRVERIVARTADKWLVSDMAKLFAELQSVKDGFADADDLWPTDAAEALRREQADHPPGDKTIEGDALHLKDVTAGKTQDGPGGPTPPLNTGAQDGTVKKARVAQPKPAAAAATTTVTDPPKDQAPRTETVVTTTAAAQVENAPENLPVQEKVTPAQTAPQQTRAPVEQQAERENPAPDEDDSELEFE